MNLVKDTVRALPPPSSFVVEAVKTEKPLSKQQTETIEIRNKVNIADDIKAMLKTVVDPHYALPALKPSVQVEEPKQPKLTFEELKR